MLIGVISDTHDRLANIDLAFAYFADVKVDMVVHCGDWKSLSALVYIAEKAHHLLLPVRGVLGNNDLETAQFITYARSSPGDFELQDGIFELSVEGGKTLAAYHGHHRPTLSRLMARDDYDIVLLGHSHKPKIEMVMSKLIVNPGSTAFSIPRSRSWQPSVAILNTDTLQAEIIFLS